MLPNRAFRSGYLQLTPSDSTRKRAAAHLVGDRRAVHGRPDSLRLMDDPTDSKPTSASDGRPGDPHPIIWFWSVKGGTGTSTVAAGAAIRLTNENDDREVVLVDLAGDQPALLGLTTIDEPDVPGISDWVEANARRGVVDRLIKQVAPGLGLVRLGTRGPAGVDYTPTSTGGRRLITAIKALARPGRVVVVDAGLDPHEYRAHVPGVPVCVIRPCYLALSRGQRVAGPYERVVVIEEPQRALRSRDVVAALGAGKVERVAWDPRVARSVDAGTIVAMLPPPLRRGLDGVVGLYNAPAAA